MTEENEKKDLRFRFKSVLFAMLPYFYTVLTIVSKEYRGRKEGSP